MVPVLELGLSYEEAAVQGSLLHTRGLVSFISDDMVKRGDTKYCYVISIAALFNSRSWQTRSAKGLVRPSTLQKACIRRTELDQRIADEGLHASAAISDFEEGEKCCKWRRPPATFFRVPAYADEVFSDDVISRVFHGLEHLGLLPPEPEAADISMPWKYRES